MDPKLIEWALALSVEDLPAPPFFVAYGVSANGHPAGITINDPAKYIAYLHREIDYDPEWIRHRNGALESELRRLKIWLTENHNPFI